MFYPPGSRAATHQNLQVWLGHFLRQRWIFQTVSLWTHSGPHQADQAEEETRKTKEERRPKALKDPGTIILEEVSNHWGIDVNSISWLVLVL